MYYNRVYKHTKGGTDFMSFEAFESLMLTPLLVAATMQLIIGDLPDEDETDLQWMTRVYLLFMTGAVPLVRDVQGFMEYGFEPAAPIWGWLSPAKRAWVASKSEKDIGVSEMLRLYANFVTAAVPVPGSGSILRLWAGVEDVLNGDQNKFFALTEGYNKQDYRSERLPFTDPSMRY